MIAQPPLDLLHVQPATERHGGATLTAHNLDCEEIDVSLWHEFLTNTGRPIFKWTHYFPIYERHFAHLRNQPATFLEIGCGNGGSLQMWKRWLGPLAVIVGLDVREECRAFEEDQIAVRIGNQADPEILRGLIEEFGPFDAVLDDGSHRMVDVNASFDYLYPRLPRSGVYMVEDMHTAYWDRYAGGLGREGTFIERSKGLIDTLNAHHFEEEMEPDPFTEETWGMHFYDSIVVFERGRRPPTRPSGGRG